MQTQNLQVQLNILKSFEHLLNFQKDDEYFKLIQQLEEFTTPIENKQTPIENKQTSIQTSIPQKKMYNSVLKVPSTNKTPKQQNPTPKQKPIQKTKPYKKLPNYYNNLEVRDYMYLAPLTTFPPDNETKNIKNLDYFIKNNIQFYHRDHTKFNFKDHDNTSNLYTINRPNGVKYYVGSDGYYYVINDKNELVPGVHLNKIQCYSLK
jgi:hypothetical protein